MRKISNARSSRRAPALKDSDYDHEIDLVDHADETAQPRALSPEPAQHTNQADHALAGYQTAGSDKTLSRYTTAASNEHDPQPQAQAQPGPSSPRTNLLDARSNATISRRASSARTSFKSRKSKGSLRRSSLPRSSRGKVDVPTVEVERKNPLCPRQGFFWCMRLMSK